MSPWAVWEACLERGEETTKGQRVQSPKLGILRRWKQKKTAIWYFHAHTLQQPRTPAAYCPWAMVNTTIRVQSFSVKNKLNCRNQKTKWIIKSDTNHIKLILPFIIALFPLLLYASSTLYKQYYHLPKSQNQPLWNFCCFFWTCTTQ